MYAGDVVVGRAYELKEALHRILPQYSGTCRAHAELNPTQGLQVTTTNTIGGKPTDVNAVWSKAAFGTTFAMLNV